MSESNGKGTHGPVPVPCTNESRHVTLPIPAFVISAFFIVQFVGIALVFFFDPKQYFTRLVERGFISWVDLGIMLAFPAAAFLGAVALLCRRKRLAIFFFACYFVPGMAYVIAGRSGWAGYMNIPITFGAALYCVYLSKKGVLK